MIAALRRSNVFSALAKLIATADVYGFVPCDVSRPVRGVGISMVLRVVKPDGMTLFLRRAMRPVVIATFIVLTGCAVAAAIPLMNLSAAIFVPLLDGIGRLSPWFVLLVPGFLLSAAFLVSYFLVRRAGHMHPMLALRCEEV